MDHKLTVKQIKLWRIAIYVIFALPGFAISSWISRTPTIRDALGASTSQMGLIILGLSVGSFIGLLTAGHLVAHKGGRLIIASGLSLSCIGLFAVGIGGSWINSSITVFLGLAIYGFGHGICGVAMNVEGTAIERAVQQSILTSFHAAYSFGMLLGALAGASAIKLGISVPIHMGFAIAIIIVLAFYFCRHIPEGTGKEIGADVTEPPVSAKERMAVWKERRTILIGIIVLGMAFAEGSANDWIPLIMVDGYNVTPALGSIAYSLFVAAMTIFRITGGFLLNRFGRVAILRFSSISAIMGLLIVIFGQSYQFAIVGVVFWGIGAACGFPVGMSAAGDDPRGVAARVSVVSTLGYLASLAGPPLIGLIGESVGLLRALMIILIAVNVAGLLSQAARPIGATGKTQDLK
ncbi:MFS transporter [Paenibacillus agri]|uniref:MFS transporter n=1 Tax=Paenibacillus agri TaxID=2744309 RepID=A0A850ECP4_9BACL|nr:MFS transporter [Paenibacillus agri]NUU59003.1 MFS transporter [Paenibacillus agri]